VVRAAVCSMGEFVPQSPDGHFNACIRLGVLPPGPATVTLEGVRGDAIGIGPAVGPAADLSLQPRSGSPGTRVVIRGTVSGFTSRHVGKTTGAEVCWDGCGLDGLIDGAVIRWASPHTFVTTFTVPEAAWVGARAVQALVAGAYDVGIECLVGVARCAGQQAEGSATFRLSGIGRERCTSAAECPVATVRPERAGPGALLRVSGWAPIGAFGLSISVSSGSPPRRSPARPIRRVSGASIYHWASTTLRVQAAPSWTSLGSLHVQQVLSGGFSPIAADPADPARLAWCVPGAVRVRGGGPLRVPTAGAARALPAALRALWAGPTPETTCLTVALDPVDPATAYAAFGLGQAPFAVVAEYTADAGRHWRLVPTPRGSAPDQFGGFHQAGRALTALFRPSRGFGGDEVVPLTETTVDGGAHWTNAPPSCPQWGPCVTLGVAGLGNCGMGAVPGQPVLLGRPGSPPGARGPVRWLPLSWPPGFDNCSPGQLVITARQGDFLVTGESDYLVLRSQHGGQSWQDIAVPRPPGSGGPDAAPFGPSLIVLPTGSVLDTSAPGTPSTWALLEPSARRWCALPHRLRAEGASSFPELLGPDVFWLVSTPLPGGRTRIALHSVAAAALRC